MTRLMVVFAILLACTGASSRQSIDAECTSPEVEAVRQAIELLDEPGSVLKRVAGTWPRTRMQGVKLARLLVSEDDSPMQGGDLAGRVTLDHMMLLRVAHNHSRSKAAFRSWDDVLAFLSPRIMGKKPPLPGTRQRWTSTLPANGLDAPSGWRPCKRGRLGRSCDGHWPAYAKRWADFRETIVQLWGDSDFTSSGTGMKPRKWGNREDVIDYLKRHARRGDGMCVLDVGTRNFFLTFPGEGCEMNDAATQAARRGEHLH